MLGNREIMAENIKRNMERKHVIATDVCQALGFKHNTFSNWVNGLSYPRIDKIEMMANYFGITKAELIEEQTVLHDYTLSENAIFLEIEKMDSVQRKELLMKLLQYEAELLKEGE